MNSSATRGLPRGNAKETVFVGWGMLSKASQLQGTTCGGHAQCRLLTWTYKTARGKQGQPPKKNADVLENEDTSCELTQA
jgi:hypothetical protein